MRSRRLVLGVVAFTVVVTAWTLWVYPSSSDYAVSNPSWNGVSEVAAQFHVMSVGDLAQLPREVRGTALVLVPYRALRDSESQRLREYVRGGGVALLGDDFGAGNGVLASLGSDVRFSGQLLADPLFNLRNTRLPRILDIIPSPITRGVEGLLLNHATALAQIGRAQVVARSSPVSYLDINRNGRRDEGEPRGPFPVAALESVGAGYLAIVADPSILLNGTIHLAHNRRFVRDVFRLAGEGAHVYFYTAPLPGTPLDEAKANLTDLRGLIAIPAAALLLAAVAVLVPAVLLPNHRGDKR